MDYDFLTIIKLIAATFLPTLLSVGVYLAEKKTRFGKLKSSVRQIIIGVLFGGIAVLGTEFGIPVEDAILNVRNAAPLAAGLLFGAPAGIISGTIGGVYRFVATYWGAGYFSQIACSVGCLLAGLFGAGCRKFMFDDKKPSWIHGLVIGGTTEVLHMLLVFIFRMEDVYKAYKVVAACAVPMIICNAVSVSSSLFVVALIGKERVKRTAEDKKIAKKFFETKQISQVFQLFLMICVVIAFSATLIFTNILQTKIAYANAENLLTLNLSDVEKDILSIDSSGDVSLIVANRHIGKEGGIIVCNAQGKILYDNAGRTGELFTGFKSGTVAQKTRFIANIGDVKAYCMYAVAGDLYLVAYIPETEAMFSRNIAVTILAFMEVVVFAALFVHVYFLIKRQIVDNIHKINNTLAQITKGNLNVQINVRENEEFASLSDDINATVDTLKRYIAEAESRIDRELEFARQIQHSALPSVFPPYPERKDFDIFALMEAAKEVGGDFYDFWLTGSSGIAFLVADVSGKGIPGAMFMMRAKTLIKNLAESGLGIDEVFTLANKKLCENNDAEMFVTAWMGVLDTETGVLQYVNAGHNPPLLRRNNGKFEYLRTRPDFILAGMDFTTYKKHELTLEKGDTIFAYTDGVTEAADSENNLYGEERLKNILSSVGGSAKKICETVRADIVKYVGETEQSDDITMLCIKFAAPPRCADKTVVPDKKSIETILDFVENTLKDWQKPAKLISKAQVITDEIYSNIVFYSGAKTASVTLTDDGEKLSIVFYDDGKPYDPTTAKEPDVTLSAEERRVGGLGIFMVKNMSAEINYKNENGNNLTVDLKL